MDRSCSGASWAVVLTGFHHPPALYRGNKPLTTLHHRVALCIFYKNNGVDMGCQGPFLTTVCSLRPKASASARFLRAAKSCTHEP